MIYCLLAMRHEVYIPSMILIENYCNRLGANFKDELRKFLKMAQEEKKILEPTINIEELLEALMMFYKSLKLSGQELEDYNFSFDDPVVMDKDDHAWLERLGATYTEDRYARWDINEKKTKLTNVCIDSKWVRGH